MTQILVADDEVTMRMLITETLSIEDYDLLEAADGREALQIIEEESPDLVLLDLMMPEYDGYEVINKVKEKDLLEEMIIVLLTAKGEKKEENFALANGADYFLSKPFSPMELLELIDKLAEQI